MTSGYMLLCWLFRMTLAEMLKNTSSARMLPVPGETYFASEQLLDSKNKDMDTFKSAFTLPQDGVVVQGTFSEISRQLTDYTQLGAHMDSLVIRIQESTYNSDLSYVSRHRHALEEFAQNFTQINFKFVKEFWFFIDKMLLDFNPIHLNIDNSSFKALVDLHMISHRHPHRISLPPTFLDLLPNLRLLDIQKVDAYVYNSAVEQIMYKNESDFNFNCPCFWLNLKINDFLEGSSDDCCSSLQMLSLHDVYRLKFEVISPTQNRSSATDKNNLTVHPKLQYLRISSTCIINNLPIGLPVILPNLKVLDVSANMERYAEGPSFTYVSFALENLLFHSALQLFISKDEYNSNSIRTGAAFQHQQFPMYDLFLERSIFAGKKADPVFNQCGSKIVSNQLANDKQMQCAAIKCLLGLSEIPCTRQYLNLDPECLWGISIPMSPTLVEIYMANRLYADYGLDFVFLTGMANLVAPLSAMLNESQSLIGGQKICICANSLTKLDFSYHSFDYLDFTLFDFEWISSSNVSVYNPLIKGLEKVNEIVMNNMQIDPEHIYSLFRYGILSNITQIYLRGNSLTFPHDIQICKTLPRLTVLDLSYNAINFIPKNFFHGCKKLAGAFLNANQLAVLPAEAQVALEHVTVDLSANPLSCECNAVNMVSWLKKHHYNMRAFHEHICIWQGEKNFIAKLDIDELVSRCTILSWHEVIMVFLSVFMIIMILVMVVCLVYKYRYRLVLSMYQLRHTCSRCHQDSKFNTPFMYDAFLSYCCEDRFWVHHLLVPQLEDRFGLKCCVHYRDFPLCGDVTEVINSYMKGSRDIIIVLSKHYIVKKWPKYELDVAHDLAKRDSKRIFYIKLGDLGKHLESSVKRIVQSKIYLEWDAAWSKDAKQTRLFFNKLMTAILGEELCGGCCCGIGRSSPWRMSNGSIEAVHSGSFQRIQNDKGSDTSIHKEKRPEKEWIEYGRKESVKGDELENHCSDGHESATNTPKEQRPEKDPDAFAREEAPTSDTDSLLSSSHVTETHHPQLHDVLKKECLISGSQTEPLYASEFDEITRMRQLTTGNNGLYTCMVESEIDVAVLKQSLKEALEDIEEAHALYTSDDEKHIIVSADPGSNSVVRTKLSRRFREYISTGIIQIQEEEDDACYLVSVGGCIMKVSSESCYAGGISASSFEFASGSIACIAVNSKSILMILTAKHLFSEEHRPQEEVDMFMAEFEGKMQTISNHYYGNLGIIKPNAQDTKERSVDIAALPVLPHIQERIEKGKLYCMKSVFTGTDKDLMNCKVWKYGPSTKETVGTVVKTDYILTGKKFRMILTGSYFLVRPEKDVFASVGDSGSLVWTDSGVPLGIVSIGKTVTINEETFRGVLCCRVDDCITSIKEEWPDMCDIVSLWAYNPNDYLAKKSYITPYSHLSILRHTTMGKQKQVHISPSKISHPHLRLVHDKIYLCNGQIRQYDLNLNATEQDGFSYLNKTEVLDIAGMPNGKFLIVSRECLQYTTDKGILQMIDDSLGGSCYSSAQYHNGEIYAMRRNENIIAIFARPNSTAETWELSRTIEMKNIEKNMFIDFWVSFDGIRILVGFDCYVMSIENGEILATYSMPRDLKTDFLISSARVCQEDVDGNCLGCYNERDLIVWQNNGQSLSRLKFESVVKPLTAILARGKLFVVTQDQRLEVFVPYYKS